MHYSVLQKTTSLRNSKNRNKWLKIIIIIINCFAKWYGNKIKKFSRLCYCARFLTLILSSVLNWYPVFVLPRTFGRVANNKRAYRTLPANRLFKIILNVRRNTIAIILCEIKRTARIAWSYYFNSDYRRRSREPSGFFFWFFRLKNKQIVVTFPRIHTCGSRARFFTQNNGKKFFDV